MKIQWLTFLLLGSTTMVFADAPLVIAHRGASYDAPENTLAAFRLAWEQKSDGIEGDFYLTADKQIVCIHDEDTERTTGVRLSVEKSTLAQLRQLDAGRWKDVKFEGEQIPTFAEVLNTVPPGRRFVIELKGDASIAPVLAAELARANADSSCLMIISFSWQTVRECKKQMPSVSTHWLAKFDRTTPLSPYRPSAKQIAETVHACRADGVGLKAMPAVIDAAFVQQLKEHGCNEFHVWTVDSPDDARHFQALGAIAITTNRPSLIGEAIRHVD